MIDELKEYVSTHKLEEKTMTREEALKWLDTIPTQGEQVDALEMAIGALENQKTGHWIKAKVNYETAYSCSNCNRFAGEKFDYCPNCGANMRGE